MSTETFYEIATANIARYPLSEMDDLYKLCHQAALGSEHALKNLQAARSWLNQELDEIASAPSGSFDEPLVEVISPRNQIVRVNLRPFLRAGGDPDNLFQAFVNTASRQWGNTALLQRYWKSIIELAGQGEIPFQPGHLSEYIVKMAACGFPATHHSQTYRQAYRPSYRVIAAEFLQAALPA